MIVDPSNPIHLKVIRDQLQDWLPVAEKKDHVTYVHGFISALSSSGYNADLAAYETFLPPRLVAAAKVGHLVPFFGAGASAGAGIPTWGDLLQQLGIPSDLASDPSLENDPLTAAELIAHEIGNDKLQQDLRRVIKRIDTPTLIHYLLARLAQPLYITTNYDDLFEKAWTKVHGGVKPIVIKNDADFAREGVDPHSLIPIDGRPILLKIHGSAEEDKEEMILTRTQYRRHYRSNEIFFDTLKRVLGSRQTLFLGFSHKDFEISRQVEDAIYRYEDAIRHGAKGRVEPPAFYSLQFDLKGRTPEIFAARGIVALQQPLALDAPKDFDFRSAGLSKALVDLIGAMDSEAHKQLDSGNYLDECVTQISAALQSGLDMLAASADKVESGLNVEQELDGLRERLGSLAGQGVYYLSHTGDVALCSLPDGLSDPRRSEKVALFDRFYVQQARTYRKPFVSDSDSSVFNGHGTFFLCHPLGGERNFRGLLFAAAQCGSWTLPQELAQRFLSMQHASSFILVDSNGVVLVPPNGELKAGPPRKLPRGEKGKVNIGYPFDDLKRISRRDSLIIRVWKNIVPLAQDDDVMWFPPDLSQYAVVSEVLPAKWKLALVSQFPARRREH